MAGVGASLCIGSRCHDCRCKLLRQELRLGKPKIVMDELVNLVVQKTGISQDNRTDAGIARAAPEFARGDVLGSLMDGLPSSPCPGPCPDAERTSRVSCLILEAVS